MGVASHIRFSVGKGLLAGLCLAGCNPTTIIKRIAEKYTCPYAIRVVDNGLFGNTYLCYFFGPNKADTAKATQSWVASFTR